MGETNSPPKPRLIGWVHLFIFAALVAGGIVVKRVFGHPELMMLFHLPAAVFLILAGYELTRTTRARYLEESESFHSPKDSGR